MTGIVDGMLTFARAFGDANVFRDRCRIERGGTEKVLNKDTGRYETVPSVVYDDLPCRLKNPYRAPTSNETEGQKQELSMAELQLPVERSTGIRAHDTVVIVSSASDPDLAGRRYTVSVAKAESDATMRRIPVTEAN
jgi:hypothetical protein